MIYLELYPVAVSFSFYKSQGPRPLEEIRANQVVEKKAKGLLEEILGGDFEE